eukprot:8358094-Pyramimonas_sp.AAC.1
MQHGMCFFTLCEIVESESAGAPAIPKSPSTGAWKFSTNSISAGCPAMGAPRHSAKSISPWP